MARCAVLLLLCLIPARGLSQTGETVVETLAGMGFENVGWTEDEVERVYVLQNSAYRRQAAGLGKALEVIQKCGLPHGKVCRIVVLNNNIPQISLCYRPLEGDSTRLEANPADWNVGYELGKTWGRRKVKLKNRSLFKIDILVYPQFSFRNMWLNKIYDVLFDLCPAVEVSFWKGMKLTAQVKIPVCNDDYGFLEDKVHPGQLTISQRFRLPYNIFGKATVGYFSDDRYGMDVSLFRPFNFDNRFSLTARLGYTGLGYWDGFRLHYSTDMNFSWSLGANFYWPQYNTQFTLKAEQYLLQEKGVKAEVIRHFRYCSIGFYAMKAQYAKANGGFMFQVLLPPYKYKRCGYIPRINTSANMGILYDAGNELYYYKTYKAETSDNIMEENSFNPYFIKSELLNY